MSNNVFSNADILTQECYDEFNAFIETLNLDDIALDIINNYVQAFYLFGKVDKYFENLYPTE